MLLLTRVTKFSSVSKLRKSNAEPRRSSKKTSETNFTTRKAKKLPLCVKGLKWKSAKGSNRSYKRQRTFNCDLKLRGRWKRNEWRKFSLQS